MPCRGFLGALAVFACVSSVAGDEALKRNFLKEYAPQLAKLQGVYSRLEGRGSYVRSQRPSRGGPWKVLGRQQWQFKRRDGLYRVERRIDVDRPGRETGIDKVTVLNPRATFWLQKPATGDQYAVTWLTQNESEMGGPEGLLNDLRVMGAPFEYYGMTIYEFLEDPRIDIHRFDASDELVTIEFTRDSGDITEGSTWKGTVEFLVPQHWALKKLQFRGHLDEGGTTTDLGETLVDVVYEAFADGSPWVKHYLLRHDTTEAGGNYDNSEEYFVDEMARVDIPESEFRLTAFGLPEPAQVVAAARQRRLRFLLTVTLVLVLLLVMLSATLWWRRNRALHT